MESLIAVNYEVSLEINVKASHLLLNYLVLLLFSITIICMTCDY